MQVTETLTDGLKRNFTVVIPGSDLSEKRDKRLAELSKTMQMPGFRPGKVPLSMVRKRFGEAVAAEVLEASVNDATDKMMAERSLRPAVSPKVEVVNAGTEADLEFKIEMEVLPDVTLPDLKSLTLTRPVAPVTDAEVDEAIAKFADQRATLVPVEEVRPAVSGDVVTVDFLGKLEGTPFDGGAAQDSDVEIGGSGFIPGFAEQIEGMSVGEEKVINVTFPTEYHAANLAGKDVTFDITVKALKQKTPVVIDDAFAETNGFETLEEFRKFFKDRLEQQRSGASRMKVKRALLDELAKQADFAAPETLVEAEFAEIWRQVEAERAGGRLDAEDAAKDEETLRAEYRAIADRRVRLGLLVAEIGRSTNVQVTEQDLRRAMINEMQQFPGQEKMIIDFYQKNPRAMDRLRGPIFEDKVVDHALELATVTDQEVTTEVLFADDEE
ncbi:MAG: trigger factor [Acidiphilium sp. 37-64-53]|uniref:trigger factor n=1 Tax=unclassified Acidiphilium TaxID=2617493 RepID=UPI000BCB82D9|nr:MULTISPECIES: trigger factor [unclassified Acidiphilium]OYW04139.1 MAG: trigger factor [Acidiphilium sp. 37-64-53]OZB31074.1 MAG: trigger factor [Acidiphilium sp. 34-64-41]